MQAEMLVLWIKSSMGIRSIIISTLACRVFLVIVVVDLTANLSNDFSFFNCCIVFIEFPQVIHAYSSFGLATQVYAHFESFGLGACIPLKLLFNITISFLHVVDFDSMCCFQVNLLSNVTPMYFTESENGICNPSIFTNFLSL